MPEIGAASYALSVAKRSSPEYDPTSAIALGVPAHKGEAVLAASDVLDAKAFITWSIGSMCGRNETTAAVMEPQMARPTFSNSHIDHLRREAKKLQRDAGISLSEAQDQIARRHSFRNWSLMVKGATPGKPTPILELTCKPYPGGDEGVFLLSIHVPDDALRAQLSKHELHFELPAAPGWLFRSALEGGGFAPYLDGRIKLVQGVFHEGQWVSILSRNGIQDHEYPEHLKTLDWVLGAVRIQAEAELDHFRNALQGRGRPDFRLFFVQGSSAQSSLMDIGFDSLDKAKDYSLPEGDVPIGIQSAAGWHTFQRAFGWQGPHPTMRRQ